MIGTIQVKVQAARPNLPMPPIFSVKGSPTSVRIMDVPKAIGDWNITNVKLVVQYPDNTTVEKVSVRTGSVWVATIEGCEVAGKVANGCQIVADGIDEDGNPVNGYVLGVGDVFILDDDTDASRLVGKHAHADPCRSELFEKLGDSRIGGCFYVLVRAVIGGECREGVVKLPPGRSGGVNALHENRRAVADEFFVLLHGIGFVSLGSKHMIAAVRQIVERIEKRSVEVENDGFIHGKIPPFQKKHGNQL